MDQTNHWYTYKIKGWNTSHRYQDEKGNLYIFSPNRLQTLTAFRCPRTCLLSGWFFGGEVVLYLLNMFSSYFSLLMLLVSKYNVSTYYEKSLYNKCMVPSCFFLSITNDCYRQRTKYYLLYWKFKINVSINNKDDFCVMIFYFHSNIACTWMKGWIKWKKYLQSTYPYPNLY